MDFEEVLRGVESTRRRGADATVSGVEYDSRRVQPGALFVAMQGGTTDGNRYIANAASQGAAVVVSDSAAAFDNAASKFPSLALVQVEHGRRALAEIAANFFRHPEKRLALSGAEGPGGIQPVAVSRQRLAYAG